MSKKYGFERKFLNQDRSGLSGTGRSGVIAWCGPLEDGVYEWRGFCVGSTSTNWCSDGFAVIKDGLVTQVTKDQAKELLETTLSGEVVPPACRGDRLDP